MSFVKCCDYPSEVNASLYTKREAYQFWYRAIGVALTISILAFAIFNVLNLVNNPNYAIFGDAITTAQLSFVVGSIVSICVFGTIGIILRSFYQKCNELITEHEFRHMNK